MVIEFNNTLRGIEWKWRRMRDLGTFGSSGKVVLLQLITQMLLQRGLIRKW